MSNFQKNLKFKKKKKSKSSKSDEGGDENQKINFTRPYLLIYLCRTKKKLEDNIIQSEVMN